MASGERPPGLLSNLASPLPAACQGLALLQTQGSLFAALGVEVSLWTRVLAPPLRSCELTLDRFLNLFMLQFPHI